ncbi:MAG: hypothetical protein Ta2F_11190 [Termitinemataceae bacterium]|nr:MAG: hypothetical protein Ta2F_11190 [Termitinemataceae bacterium]
MYDNCIIMAGGSGTRLWPASNSITPKQFLNVPCTDETFFCQALRRAFSVTESEKENSIVIIAGTKHQKIIEAELNKFSAAEKKRILFIPEPCAKNTAAAIAMAAVYCSVASKKNNPAMLVLTSDHIIEPTEVFTRQALLFCEHIKNTGLAVFGIKPCRAETGYGYIEVSGNKKTSMLNATSLNVISFHEKPDKETAEKYLKAGNFLWNSGMFAFSADFILNEFMSHAPAVLLPFKNLKCPQENAYTKKDGIMILQNWDGLSNAYNNTVNISFDYAIAEKCTGVIACSSEFTWKDIGSWDEYAALTACTNKQEQHFLTDSANNFILSDIPVAVCGCDDLIIVIRSAGDGLKPVALVAKKGTTQNIRSIVEQIKDQNINGLL